LGCKKGTMEDRFELADTVVGAALQSLSRGLYRIGNRDGELTESDVRLLLDSTRRTASLWQLVIDCAGIPEALEGKRCLDELAGVLQSQQPAVLHLVERLAADLDADSADALRALVAADVTEHRVDLDRDRLSVQLMADSRRWRGSPALRRLATDELLEQGIVRAFRRTERRYAVLLRKGAGPGRLRRAGCWTRHCLNHQELLRQALSEEGRARHWHLNHLATRLDDELALLKLGRLIAAQEGRPKLMKRLSERVLAERMHIEQQRLKLAGGAFRGGQAAYRAETAAAVAQLVRHSLMRFPKPEADARPGVLEEA
jgi:hypothetical protein